MSEEKLSSNKLDIEGAQRISSGEQEKLREFYKPISENIGLSDGKFCSYKGRLLSFKCNPNV